MKRVILPFPPAGFKPAALALLLVLVAPAARADVQIDKGGKHKLSILLDARVGVSDAEASHRDRGVGLLRLGGKDTDTAGLGEKARLSGYLGQLGLQFTGRMGPYTSYMVELNSQLDGHERTGLSVPEAFISHEARWHTAALRFRAGFLIPPVSLEHPGRAWSTFFTLTPSAINSWIGEEIRGTGFEGRYSLRLAQKKRLSVTLGTFMGNDTAGQLLSWRGWAMHDRQAGYGDRTRFRGNRFLTSPQFFGFTNPYARPFLEMDENWGMYGSVNLETTRTRFSYLAWDNRADRTEREKSKLFGWDTQFQAVGWRYEPVDRRFMVQGQWMRGSNRMGGGHPARVENDYNAWYVLFSKPSRFARFTLRYDDFWVKDHDIYRTFDPNGQDGRAVTFAVVKSLNKQSDLVGEVVNMVSNRPGNALLGADTHLEQTQWQLAWRFYR